MRKSKSDYPANWHEIATKIKDEAGCPKDGIVYDPFGGAMTTALVALRAERNFICSEINPEYCDIGEKRLRPYLDQHKLAL